MDNKAVKILLIEDNPGDVRLIREMLAEVKEHQYELTVANHLSTGLETLGRENFDVILLDLGLPDSQRLEALDRVLAQAPTIPILVLTGLNDEAAGIEAIHKGAADYIIKGPISGRTLWRIIRYSIERKQNEKALKASESKFRELVENMSSAVAVYQAKENGNDFVFKDFNRSGEQIEQVKREDIINKSVIEVFPGVKDFGLFQVFQRVWRTGKPEHFPAGLYRDERIAGWRENYIYKLPSGEIVAIYDDITAKKKAEEALRESEAKLKSIFHTVPAGVGITVNRVFTEINNRLCDLTGYSKKELLNKSARILYTTEELFTSVGDELNKQIADKGVATLETKWQQKDGMLIDVLLNSTKLNPDDKTSATVSIILDITERKRAEAARHEFELKAISASHLASVGELAAGVAHEINNPLTAIMGYAQLLMENSDITQEIRTDLNSIYTESQRTARIVQNLLSFARQSKLEKTVLDINDLVERTLELRRYKLNTSNISVQFKLAPNLPLVLGDQTELLQVILNIIINAEQATREGKRKGRIVITTSLNKGNTRISISDNGPGIPKENMNRIFDPFFTTKKLGEGTGLGLSICHGIVKEHGGNIYAQSERGKGATFIIELPMAAAEAKAPEQAVKAKRQPRPLVKRSKRILAVDDEPAILEVITRILSQSGYTIDTASSAKEALDKMSAKQYHAYLLDVKMPDVSGEQLFRTMQKRDPDYASKVIFMTGDVIAPTTQKFIESTKRPYLDKPLDFGKLGAMLEELPNIKSKLATS